MTLLETCPLELSAPVNLRDLGGTPVADGLVADGFALRSDDLAIITDAAADELVTGGLRSVIDLRSRDEVLITGRGPLLDRAVNYHHIPFMTSIRDSLDTRPDPAAIAATAPLRSLDELPSMHDMYVSLFENAPGAIVMGLAVMAHSDGATAFHCAAGKDRTGVLAAALLLALGAEDDVVVSDYRATYKNLQAISARTGSYMSQVMARAGYDLQAMREDRLDSAERVRRDELAMEQTLSTLRARYREPLTPLREAGLSTALIDTLRARAVVA